MVSLTKTCEFESVNCENMAVWVNFHVTSCVWIQGGFACRLVQRPLSRTRLLGGLLM